MHKFFAKTQFIGKNVIYLPQCHSTNTEMQTFLKKASLEEGTVVMADFQIKGRGQLKDKWVSQKGKNILMSVLLKPTFLSLDQQFYLTIALGLAIVDALGHFIGNDLKIKWPNDVYVGANKIAGILTEASVSKKSIDHAVIGVGVNINQQEFGTLKATSILLETGLYKNKDHVMELIFLALENWYQKIKNRQYSEIILKYHALLYWRNERHTFGVQEKQMEGKIKGINDRGQLIIEIRGKEVTFNHKELIFIK
jgi:BirA family biotin operon repressor/biotin-[acetyl-CoA-carboxylase] ligase